MDTRLSCRTFAHNAVRLRLHALACKLGYFMCTLALPNTLELRFTEQPARETHQDRPEDGCYSKANFPSSDFESHSTGWEGSI